MSLTRYRYSQAISGFFELPTENAVRILPKHLQPIELHHGGSVLNVTVFDFTDSLVGAYREVFYAVMASPYVRPGERIPKAAFYAFLVATTTQAARAHAIERWHLPHWMEDIAVEIDDRGGSVATRADADGKPFLEMTITDHSWSPVSHLYQSFMADGATPYVTLITMEGSQSEHEEGAGSIVLHDHPFNAPLELSQVEPAPFREIWMKDGVQSFTPLQVLPL
jgi:hypothetical protein